MTAPGSKQANGNWITRSSLTGATVGDIVVPSVGDGVRIERIEDTVLLTLGHTDQDFSGQIVLDRRVGKRGHERHQVLT